ncbi:MAG: FAD-binding protein [Coriobacteriaceae bacterium]|nr:FAD-binding protein [Coriobacteriaceae bacterium]
MLEITEIPCTLKHGATESGCVEAGTRVACKLLGIAKGDIAQATLRRKSIDARKKSDVHFMLSIRVDLAPGIDELSLLDRLDPRTCRRVRAVDPEEPHFPSPLTRGVEPDRTPSGSEPSPARSPHATKAPAASMLPPVAEPCPSTRARMASRPVVVGAGCAGLFAALTLAEAGLEPLLIEQGDDATRRTEAVERFNSTGELDSMSNIQFGLGGAGTFSDGKLNTGTKNPLHRLVLRTLVEAGAPRDILWDAKPHIGSDILPTVVTAIVARIERLGGEVRFRTRLIDLERNTDGSVKALHIEQNGREERIEAQQLILACGHSARPVFELLARRGITLERKTFAMGVRIEHLQADIDRVLYGTAAGHPALGAAPYSLVAHLPNGRSLFSFCMCPGGQVVAAASEEGGVVTNGASLHARAGANANAALLVNVTPEDLPGTDPLEALRLQRACEKRAYQLGGGSYRAPAQLVGDFLAQRPSTRGGRIKPTYPRGVTWTALDEALPAHIIETLRAGIPLLDRKLRGYNDPEAVLTGVETRSSSPITITRDRATCISMSAPGLYPCGEGAGYAGGIMSAATDGIRCAQALINELQGR